MPEDLWVIYESFPVFLHIVWKHLGLPAPTPVQLDFALALQLGGDREILEAFRGLGKSFITVAFAAWCLLRNPQINIEIVSASGSLAEQNSTFLLRLISEMPILRHLRPKENQRSRKTNFDVGPAGASKDPSVKAVGITGQITGTRADIIVADDIEVPKNSETPHQREKLAELVKEFDAILKPGGRIIYLGTPQTEQSIYNVLRERGYKVTIWPVEYPNKDYMKRMEGSVADFIKDALESGRKKPGDPVEPSRFTLQELASRKASYGLSGYALQFMLDTKLSDAERYPLKLRDLMVIPVDGQRAPRSIVWGPKREQAIDMPVYGLSGDGLFSPAMVSEEYDEFTGSLMFIDPSGKGTDETSWCVTKVLNAMIFVTKIVATQGGYEDTVLRAIAQDAKDQKVNKILYEEVFGQGMFGELLKPHLEAVDYPCTVEGVPTGQSSKESRILDTLEPVIQQHRLVICETVLHEDEALCAGYRDKIRTRYRLQHQLTRITRTRGCLANDDRIDALAGAVMPWSTAMGQSSKKASERARERALLKRVKELEAGQLKNLFKPKKKPKKSRFGR